MKLPPLHERIRADMERRILSGDLAPGDRLPTESDLCEDYGCARMTVNKALTALVASGLIERRKKAGSFVTRPRVHSMVLNVPDLQAEVRQRGCRYDFRLLSRSLLQNAPGQGFDPAADGTLLSIKGVHLSDRRPLAYEERIVNLAAVPAMEQADLSTVAPGTWLLEHVPWTEAETRISATAADASLGKILELKVGAPCLVVERRTWRGSEGITSVRQCFDARAYDLVARFSPAGR